MTLDFCDQRPPQLVVGEAHNIRVVTESLFAAGGRYIYLWPEATRLSKSHAPTKIGTYGQYKYEHELLIYVTKKNPIGLGTGIFRYLAYGRK